MHDVLGIYHHQSIATDAFQIARVDLLNESVTTFSCLLKEWKPDWIVHCAALADINLCEENPEFAHRMNAELPGQLAALANEYNAKFLFVSTDCIFDGKKEGHVETDAVTPVNMYGKTKLLGEQIVLKKCSTALIARVNFYGWSMTGKRSLSEWIINNLRAQKTITGFTDVIFCSLLTNSLVNILLGMMSLNLTGIYHVVGNDKLSKFDFAVLIARQFGLDENLIVPSSVKQAKFAVERPLNMVLNNNKLQSILGAHIPTMEADIKKLHQLELEGYVETLYSINNQRIE
jgi:dTDP-4-dehydrorhamnose reductase